ncbi:VIP36-like vesicular integral membrane protein [Tubulinosema ratisbonensis]|uniref:VIP36-like vesicular integral membrane protein n=1 Tax=Tubulinosema ratisbonensis TaxID=291195 RepID=A0A437AK72_9MICR|nr:VIP36-like vesicular integral membrane protein [Tubulinosema ratisbonensis]
MNLIFNLVFVYSLVSKKYVFNTAHSLLGPPVKLNGLNDNFFMKNDYLVLAHSSLGYSYTKLGHPKKSSSGSVISKEKLKKNTRLDFKFKYNIKEKGNQQICLWLSDTLINKVTEIKNGLCLVITFNNSSINLSSVLGNNLSIKNLPKVKEFDLPKEEFILRIEKEKNKVRFLTGTQSNLVFQHEWKNDFLREDYYFGVEVKQNEGNGSFLLTGIRTYDIVDIKRDSEKKNKFGIFSWMLFICAAGGLGYYLYKNYSKYK